MPDWFIYTIITIVLLGLLIALAAVARQLGATGNAWSLSTALSEEADITVPDAAGLPYSVNGVPVKKTELVASSSRLIAFLGTLAILFLFIGFGVVILWNFAKNGTVPPGTKEAMTFLVGGLTLFAPYVVNKFSSVFAPK